MSNQKSFFTLSGFFQGMASWFIWLFLTSGILMIFAEVSGNETIDSDTLFLVSFCLAFWTARQVSKYENKMFNLAQETRFRKFKKSFILYPFILFFVAIIGSESGITTGREKGDYILAMGLSSMLAILIIFGSPILYRSVLSFFSRKSNSRNPSSPPQRSWFMDKIVAPIIVGTILGLISYAITGAFPVSGGVTLLSIPVTWVMGR